MKLNPKFITLEGVDGAGKSTCIKFIKKYLTDKNHNSFFTREPGGTLLGEKLREILLHDEITPETETLLMFAARNEHVQQVITPNLQSGINVISDRFTDATYAYQSGGKYVDSKKITVLKNWVHVNLKPDLTLLFDLPIDVSLTRLKSNGNLDKFEKESSDFHKRIRNSYLDLAKKEPSRFKIIDSNQNINIIEKEIYLVLDKLFS
ncbi:dTMP kinase [Methylophilaceae bacterium]|jgi:dTMP kinase|nr:dTMP kinase [Methylophilaceae bacterium]|tara:strand:+ start:852 stop:1469 length:618 start_codon:yes stop_codon:yes gene_type:complete